VGLEEPAENRIRELPQRCTIAASRLQPRANQQTEESSGFKERLKADAIK